MTTATMTRKELMDNELNLVNGGEDADTEKTILDILNEYDFDERKDPFYDPDPQFPWAIKMPVTEPLIPFDPDMLKNA